MASVVNKASRSLLLLGLLIPILSWAAPPIAVDDLYTIVEGNSLNQNLFGNDSDPDPSSTLELSTHNAPAEVSILPDGSMTYTPDPNFSGEIIFTYEVFGNDPPACIIPADVGCIDTATVTIRVNAVATPPAVFNTPAASGDEDTSIPLIIDVVAQDIDGSETIDVLISNIPATATLSSGTDLGAGTYQLTLAELVGLQYIPQLDQIASAILNVQLQITDSATDGLGINTDSITVGNPLSVTVNPLNDAPQVSVTGLVAQVLDEDTGPVVVDVSVAFEDVDFLNGGDTHSYSVLSITGAAIIQSTDVTTNILTLDLAEHQYGLATVTVRATDSAGATADAPMNLQVNSVNDPPEVAAAAPDVNMTEDGTADVPLAALFEDPDTLTGDGPLVLTVDSISGDPVIDTAIIGGTILSLTLIPETFGNAVVTIRADDGLVSVTTTVNVNVSSVNDTPVLSGVPLALVVDEDSGTASVDVSVAFDDIDLTNGGDTLTYTVAGIAGDPIIDSTNVLGNVVELELLEHQYGLATVTVRATDAAGATVDAPLNLEVNSVNDPPEVAAAAPDVNMTEDGTADVPLAALFEDPDTLTGDGPLVLTVDSISGDPVIDTAIIGGTILSLTLIPETFGNAIVTIRADDGLVSVTTTVNVNVSSVNDTPVLTGVPLALVVDEDSGTASVDVSVAFDDIDLTNGGDTLTYTVAGIAGDSIIDSTNVLGNVVELELLEHQYGLATVTVRATDAAGATVDAPLNLQVNSVNDPPEVVGAAPDMDITEDSTATLLLAALFEDPDTLTGDGPLVLTVDSISGDPVIDTATIIGTTLSLTLISEAFGNAVVTIRADDGLASVTTTVNVNVSSVNDTPVLTGVPLALVVDEDSGTASVDVSVAFDDIDLTNGGDTLTYTVAGIAGDSIIDSTNVLGNVVELELLEHQSGNAVVTVRATDLAGAFVDTTLNLLVNPVNDAPTVVNPIANMSVDEDGLNATINLNTVFDDVDILTDGDDLTFQILSNSDASLFTTAQIDGAENLILVSAPDTNGSATLIIQADDGQATITTSFVITLISINDIPAPQDDVASMNEDAPTIVIDVLANDYLAETPTTLVIAGVGGFSESPPTSVVDQNGDPQAQANGSVTIAGATIEYTPKPNFYGVDFFNYSIQDVDGDVGTGMVTVTVLPVNDAPTGTPQRTFLMVENEVLTVSGGNGLLDGAYDVDGKLVDPMTGLEIGVPFLSAIPTSFPVVGNLTFDEPTGTFTYEPPINFVGEVNFTYRLFDNIDTSPVDHEVRIVVIPAAPPPPPPPAGEVSLTFNLANSPLEQSGSVQPNVLVMMDDSGSMDWDVSIQGDDESGRFELDNDFAANSSVRVRSYSYLWDLDNNSYAWNDGNGRRLPTQDALEADSDTDNSRYGVWRARSPAYNNLYYDPATQYQPWKGQDALDQPFGNANPLAIRLDPIDPTNTFNILALHSYTAHEVPRWRSSGGTENLNVNNLYIPYYYSTAAAPPVAWDAANTKVTIQVGSGPLAGDMFPGGAARNDCRAVDDNPLDCTYAQEIQNFANWFQYYRKREYVAKAGIGGVVADAQDIRVGYETLNERASEDVREMNDVLIQGNKKVLLDAIYSVNSSSGTPLRDALERAGEIYRCNGPGTCPVLSAPQGTCQQNFTLLFSDGYWNGAEGVSNNQDNNGAGPWDGGRYADNREDTLADTAMYYYERDLQPGLDDRVPPSSRDVAGAPAGTFGPDTLMHQHMKTYTIAFGVVGSIDPATVPVDPTTPFVWPDPEASSAAKIDDMLHAAVNGRGRFLSATNPQQLKSAIEAAFLEFSSAESSASAAAFNSTSLQQDTLLFRGFYDLRNNTGELSATEVNDDGTLSATPLWLASEQLDPANKLPSDRRLVTYDRITHQGLNFLHPDLSADLQLGITEQQVNYLRGVRSDEAPGGLLRQRQPSGGLLGDIVNSSPIFVGIPPAINRDHAPYPITDLYSDFVEAYRTRQPVVYVGANDGMLHGFDASSGEEVLGFIPSKLLNSTTNYANRLEEFTSPFYQHNYYVDLTPRLNDVYMRGSRTAPTRDWNTVLVGGLGSGGKGFFAINVTDPGSQYANALGARNSILWEFTDDDDSYPLDSAGTPVGGFVGARIDPNGNPVKDLGYALSLPMIAMSNKHEAGPASPKDWVAIFGNGPNSTAGNAKLYVLFMEEGLDGWAPGDYLKIDTERGVPVPPAQLAGFPNGLGSVTTIDEDLNGTVDLVYAGDRLGNLYRFDLRDTDPDNWDYTLLFSASYDEGGIDRIQPILAQPLVFKHPSEEGFMVVVGTGSYIAREDGASEEIQSIYGIWDRMEASPATAQSGSKQARLIEQTVTNVVDDSSIPSTTRRIVSRNPVTYTPESGVPGTYGWYIDLDMPRAVNTLSGAANGDASGNAPPGPQFPGERAIRRMLFRDGNIVTTTILPSTGETSCFGSRPGAIMLFDALSGGDAQEAVIDFNSDGVIDENDLVDVGGDQFAGGLLFNQDDFDGPLVDLSHLGGQDGADFLFVSGGGTTTSFRFARPNDNRTGRLSWRDLTGNQ